VGGGKRPPFGHRPEKKSFGQLIVEPRVQIYWADHTGEGDEYPFCVAEHREQKQESVRANEEKFIYKEVDG